MLSLTTLDAFIEKHYSGRKPTDSVLRTYRQRIGANGLSNGSSIDESDLLLKDALVFVSDRPNYFFMRVSDVLRRHGIRTVLVTRWGVEPSQARFFNHIILYDELTDLKHLKKCRNCKIYVQSWVGWNILPVYVQKITGDEIYCNINDLTSLLFDDPEHGNLIGLSRPEMEMDLRCEKLIMETFPFVTLPYKPVHIDDISPGLSQRVDKHIFYFTCYPSASFFRQPLPSAAEKDHKLLFVGGIPPDKNPDAVFRYAKIQDIVRKLLSQAVRLTILNNPQISLGNVQKETLYPYFEELSKNHENFTFRDGIPPWQFKGWNHPFHYGLMLYSFQNLVISKKHYQCIVPSKLFTYAELGLPVLVSDGMLAVSELVNTHQIGCVIKDQEIDHLDRQLAEDATDYDNRLHHLYQFRERFEIGSVLQPFVASHFKI